MFDDKKKKKMKRKTNKPGGKKHENCATFGGTENFTLKYK